MKYLAGWKNRKLKLNRSLKKKCPRRSIIAAACVKNNVCSTEKRVFDCPPPFFSARVLTLDRLGLKSTLAEKKYGGQKKLLYLPRCIITILHRQRYYLPPRHTTGPVNKFSFSSRYHFSPDDAILSPCPTLFLPPRPFFSLRTIFLPPHDV